MYTIGILEDEVIEQEALCMIVGKHPDLSVAFVAENSEQAWENLLRVVPDILLVDVNLPGENGLEFGKRLRDKGYEGQIIINTAYAQFEYAQSAVQIKAFDYLLKPCNPQRISDVLTACIDKLNREEAARQHQSEINQLSGSYIYEHLVQADAKLLPRLEPLGWPPNGKFQTLVLDFRVPNLENPVQLPGTACRKALFLYQRVLPGHILVIAQPRKALSSIWLRAIITLFALSSLNTLPQTQLCVISPVCTNLDTLAHQIHILPEFSNPDTDSQIPIFFSSPAPAQAQMRKYTGIDAQISRMLRDKKFSRFRSQAESWAGKSSDDYAAFLCSLMNALYLCNINIPPFVEHQVLNPIINPQEAISDLLSVLKKELGLHDGQSTMNLAIEIIENEFDTPLSQGNMAKRLGMSQSYFSTQFKKCTHMNYVDYLTKVRMEHAQKLIAQHASVTLDELAAACGCTSGYYFCNVFHKYMGMTVSEYREKLETQRQHREANHAPLV